MAYCKVIRTIHFYTVFCCPCLAAHLRSFIPSMSSRCPLSAPPITRQICIEQQNLTPFVRLPESIQEKAVGESCLRYRARSPLPGSPTADCLHGGTTHERKPLPDDTLGDIVSPPSVTWHGGRLLCRKLRNVSGRFLLRQNVRWSDNEEEEEEDDREEGGWAGWRHGCWPEAGWRSGDAHLWTSLQAPLAGPLCR